MLVVGLVVAMSYFSFSSITEPPNVHWKVAAGSATTPQEKVALRPIITSVATGGVVILAGTVRREGRRSCTN